MRASVCHERAEPEPAAVERLDAIERQAGDIHETLRPRHVVVDEIRFHPR
jgi:hypothetical protein